MPLSPGQVLIFGSFLAHRSASKWVNYSFDSVCTLLTPLFLLTSMSPNPRAAVYATYNAMSDGGDKHDEYYVDRRAHWPPTSERQAGINYDLGALRYGFGSPMDGAQKHSRMIMEQVV